MDTGENFHSNPRDGKGMAWHSLLFLWITLPDELAPPQRRRNPTAGDKAMANQAPLVQQLREFLVLPGRITEHGNDSPVVTEGSLSWKCWNGRRICSNHNESKEASWTVQPGAHSDPSLKFQACVWCGNSEP